MALAFANLVSCDLSLGPGTDGWHVGLARFDSWKTVAASCSSSWAIDLCLDRLARVHRVVPKLSESRISLGAVHVGCIVLALPNPSTAGDLVADGGFTLSLASMAESTHHIHGHHCAAFSDLPWCRKIDLDRSVPEWATHFTSGYNRLRKNCRAATGFLVE